MRFFGHSAPDDATMAKAEAKEVLEKISQRDDEVQRVSSALKGLRERNHFADQLRLIMSSGRG